MRFEITFYLEKREIPIDYRSGLLSFFKKALENYDKDIFQMIYGVGQKKDITFSPFILCEQITKTEIHLKNNILKVFYSAEDQLLGLHIFNSFLNIREQIYPFFNNKITLLKIIKLKEKEIKEETAFFKIMSPVIIREQISSKKSWYYLLDNNGVDILKKNLIYSLKNKFPEKYLDQLEIVPLDIKKTITSFYGIKMMGSLGIVKVKGKKEILNYLYKSGISTSRKSSGFGMVDILD